MSLKVLSDIKCFGGNLKRYSHQSTSTACEMKFTIYLPPAAQQGNVPVRNTPFINFPISTSDSLQNNRCSTTSLAWLALMRTSLPKLEPNVMLLKRALLWWLLIQVHVSCNQWLFADAAWRWSQHRRRRWFLRLWKWCWILCECYRGQMEQALQHVLLHHSRTSFHHQFQFPCAFRQTIYHWPQASELEAHSLLT